LRLKARRAEPEPAAEKPILTGPHWFAPASHACAKQTAIIEPRQMFDPAVREKEIGTTAGR
jgi:hypothetical protein